MVVRSNTGHYRRYNFWFGESNLASTPFPLVGRRRRRKGPLRGGILTPAFADLLRDYIEYRHKGDGQEGGGQHAAEDHGADGLLAGSAGAAGDYQGHHPEDEGEEVMTMGRKRRRVASTAASVMDMPPSRSSRANSTTRMAFLLARAIINTRPTWV